jgi:hypothetical protein
MLILAVGPALGEEPKVLERGNVILDGVGKLCTYRVEDIDGARVYKFQDGTGASYSIGYACGNAADQEEVTYYAFSLKDGSLEGRGSFVRKGNKAIVKDEFDYRTNKPSNKIAEVTFEPVPIMKGK